MTSRVDGLRDLPLIVFVAAWFAPIFWFVVQILVLDKTAAQAFLSPITMFGVASAAVLTAGRVSAARNSEKAETAA